MPGLNPFDGGILTFVQTYLHNPVTDQIFPIFTNLGEGGLLWFAVALLLLLFKSTRRSSALMLCAMAVGFLLGEVGIKNLVCRPRPFAAYPGLYELLIPPPSGFSFPSGHTCASFAAATVLTARRDQPGWYHWAIVGAAWVFALLIAFSRIFLFVHYPTDVLAGGLLGTLSALAVLWADKKLRALQLRKK